jgi:hypothetical protein
MICHVKNVGKILPVHLLLTPSGSTLGQMSGKPIDLVSITGRLPPSSETEEIDMTDVIARPEAAATSARLSVPEP